MELELAVSSVASGSGTALSDPNENRLEYRSITSLTGSRSSCEVIVAGVGGKVGSWMFSPFATRSVKSISSLRYSEKKTMGISTQILIVIIPYTHLTSNFLVNILFRSK